MGLFKTMKDMAKLTKQARQLQEQNQQQAGYQPGLGGMMSQMGDLVGVAGSQMGDLMERQADQGRLLAEGLAAEAVIIGMGTPARGAQQYNLDLDLEVHVPGRPPYRVANSYLVPASAPIGPGVRLPVRVDRNDQSKIAIDWRNVGQAPAHGEVRPVAETAWAPAGVPSGSDTSGIDIVQQLERLARLRDSGALTQAEFEQQKARLLGA